MVLLKIKLKVREVIHFEVYLFRYLNYIFMEIIKQA